MQLLAKDETNKLVFIKDAHKQQDYRCLECCGLIRKRSGVQRQEHFYHITLNPSCSQSGKSLTHLQIQLHLQQLFGPKRCTLEQRMDSINRIADVVLTEEKIIFEIQCSPISKEEIDSRTHDYESLGFQVIWILHDKTFLKKRLSSNKIFYHTNINEKGIGLFYDSTKHFPIAINNIIITPTLSKVHPPLLHKRKKSWPYHFEGDLTDYYLQNPLPPQPPLPKRLLKSLFYLLLEHACK